MSTVNFPGDSGIVITWPTFFFGLHVSIVNWMTILVHSLFQDFCWELFIRVFFFLKKNKLNLIHSYAI